MATDDVIGEDKNKLFRSFATFSHFEEVPFNNTILEIIYEIKNTKDGGSDNDSDKG
jgi:hypothetical protein